ncbi:unnamed protein product [Clonostachys rhizophaga]|uniref:NADH-cytochrome b5 reductase 1 n=1 Tax=Clonostachys rhizophaga TaxID=160324 RepID=A0A9N9YMK9_9HYPO|nr:unnamed protein product [Clonostachys rhizophaga]
MAPPTVSLDEVSKHNNENDAWLVISNRVYDVTSFLEDHPGGAEILLEEAGKDATESFEDVGHSEEARELLENMLIGQLANSQNHTRKEDKDGPHSPTANLPAAGERPASLFQLDPQQWHKLSLRGKTAVSPNVFQFRFNLPVAGKPLGLPVGQHIMVRAFISGENVSRSYTPISDDNDLGYMDLLIKVYPKGAMTKHLESLTPGDEVEFRGPKGNMEYSRGYAAEIGMIAGGTGITPMYQLIRAVCLNPMDDTAVSLLYANNSLSDILLRKELDSLAKQFPHKFQVHYILVHPPPGWTGSFGYVTGDLLRSRLPGPSNDARILMCGPPPMLSAIGIAIASLGYQRAGVPSRMPDEVFSF